VSRLSRNEAAHRGLLEFDEPAGRDQSVDRVRIINRGRVCPLPTISGTGSVCRLPPGMASEVCWIVDHQDRYKDE
jgi:hypothetical protein